MPHDRALFDVDGADLRRSGSGTGFERQVVNIVAGHAPAGRKPRFQLPKLLAVFEAQGPAGALADEENFALKDAAQIHIVVPLGIPESASIAEVQTKNRIMIGSGENHFAVLDNR